MDPMTRAMTKLAPGRRRAAMMAVAVAGLAGSSGAWAFAPAQPVAPSTAAQQPGYPPVAAPATPAAVPQPGYPPAPAGSGAASPPASGWAGSPPQYPPQPQPAYPQGTAPSGPPSGYPQQGYPPPGYPQQYPPQYPPQQGYPQDYPPPQGYPPPGYPQQYPPAGYPQQPPGQPGYPPPGYAYPPAGYPMPSPPPPPSTRPHGHGALLLLPYFGVQANEGSTGQDQNAGLRLGGMIGYRANGQFSFNAELTMDVLNPKNAPKGVDLSGVGVDLAFSPLFHFDAGALELVIGPKLGVGVTLVDAVDDVGKIETSATGFVYGANLGAFLPLSNGASLGALVNFEVRNVSQTCTKIYDGAEACVDRSDANSDKILGVTAAALF